MNENTRLNQDDVGRRKSPSVLDSMSGDDFVSSVTSAEEEAIEAVEALDDMVTWLKRLRPYFDRHPEMTVAQALERYHKDHRSKTSSTA